MKSKILVFLFGVAFMVLAQSIVYYGTPANWETIKAALNQPIGLLYNFIFFVLPILMMILFWRMIGKEEESEKQKRINEMRQIFKEALKEDRDEAQKTIKGKKKKK